MRSDRGGDAEGLAELDPDATRVLGARRERQLLGELAECRRTLAEALADLPGAPPAVGADDPGALARYLAAGWTGDGRVGARLGAVYRRYGELRATLALANLRLVAHVAKRFRDRGIAQVDLIQEGFCGLLEAIDRFDLSHRTKLATYATWWIRQAMQRAVAEGAYPVRLSPRHLRQLARSQDARDPAAAPAGAMTPAPHPDLIGRIQTATRPAVSLDAALDPDGRFRLVQVVRDPAAAGGEAVDAAEAVGKLLRSLRSRERQVLALRFGLGGKPRQSLSQVGKVLRVSKERVRQIQDGALRKLRAVAAAGDLADALAPGA